MDDMYTIHPAYSHGVKITNWNLRQLACPYDFRPSPKNAHYRTLGPNQNLYVTKSTTHESLEKGITKNISGGSSNHSRTRRPITNFTSFPSLNIPGRFTRMEKQKTDCDLIKKNIKLQENMTTYKRSYIDHRKGIIQEPPVVPDIQEACPLFNRISKNDFELIGPLAPYKFMDDHLLKPTPQKRLSNYYKQIRMVSYNPWLGTFR